MTRPVNPSVSVIVPTLGGAVLHGCLESIAAGTRWPARLIVVDQGDDAGPDAWVAGLCGRGLDAVRLRAPRRGISAATNLGFQHATTPFVAVTHDDCRVRETWLERLAARLASDPDAIVTGRVEPEGEGVVLTIKTAQDPAVYSAPLIDGDVLFPPSMGCALDVYRRVGPFDEHPSLATAGEDNEWAHRALRAGVRIIYDPSAAVGHLAHHRRQDLAALYRRYARGQGAFYGTWLRRRDPFIALRVARDLARAPWLLLRGIVTRNPDLVAMGQGEVRGLLPGILSGLQNRGVRGGLRP